MKSLPHLCILFALASLGSTRAALVAHYNFDDSGSLGANTGTAATSWNSFSGISQTTGTLGAGAGNFTTSSQAWNNAFNVGANLNNFTLSMHVKTTQTNAWKDFVSIGTTNNVVFVLEQNGAGGVSVFNIGNVGGTGGGQVTYTGSAVNDGAWHHLGITVADSTLTLYVDGTARGTAAYTGSGSVSAFQLASRFGDGTRALAAEIDDVAVYDTALSTGQMNFLATNAAVTNPVPEPTATLLGALGLLALLRRRR